MKSLLLILSCAAIAFAQETCGPCKQSECRRPWGCVAGTMKDRCGCCDICGNREGMRCDADVVIKHDPSKYKYGKCGKNLVCKLHHNSKPEYGIETVCYCKYDDMVCGTNDKTYDNVCQMVADGYRYGKQITVKSKGPCTSAPWIETPPDDIVNSTGGDITLSCEVMGHPIPYIEWKKEGNPVVLPGDDRHMAVQSRGGPHKHELTGWLQIQGLRKTDVGQYTCVARNDYGVAQATAAISVMSILSITKRTKRKKTQRIQ
ncbi:kazal-type serine protease inhibitor domain-containing protein 1-like [Saccoglossus kowalevskii]|uniref:Kazal-type serine protease inhibitor domain-containing protein 1-like n=1 Tax=Saccoglossus kowalevskii TaxID=10224 RepID=A0ABM0GR80_SACKO|nr:PREDICTED: kazal-type serine protease inhibitor domain-containing protein 1-like [Saccoglossus kowalevskii]